MSRRLLFVGLFVGCGLVAAPSVLPLEKRLILNGTNSAPLGFYWLSSSQPTVGDLALVRPPSGLARWMALRGYLPLNVPLIKRLVAAEGQFVCVRARVVTIDGARAGVALQRDRLGRALHPTTVCRPLEEEEVFLLNADPRSLDGRYFGPMSRASIAGRLTPLWTWER
jgi:conjugative transfer signal peptidase TraF